MPKVIDPRAAAASTSLVNQLVGYIHGATGLEEVVKLAALVAAPRADPDAQGKAERRRTAAKAAKLSNRGSQKWLMNSNKGSSKPTVQHKHNRVVFCNRQQPQRISARHRQPIQKDAARCRCCRQPQHSCCLLSVCSTAPSPDA